MEGRNLKDISFKAVEITLLRSQPNDSPYLSLFQDKEKNMRFVVSAVKTGPDNMKTMFSR